MRGRGDWITLAVLGLIAGVLVLVSSTRQGDNLNHNSNSDGFHGTSALRLLAGDTGHPTSQLDLAFNPEAGNGVLFIFSPTNPFSGGDAQRLAEFVRAGGIAVYADEQLDPRIAAQFKLRASAQPIPTIANATIPVFANVHRVSDDTTSRYFVANPEQAAILRHPKGPPLALETRLGSGRLIALTSPCLLCNGYITHDDNAVLAADLLALAPRGAKIVFDEYHHAALAGSAGDWNLTLFGIATWWAVVILFLGLAIRGRAFGPRLPTPGSRDRSSAEYAVAVGHLLRQAGGRSLALEVGAEATRRQLADRIGIRRDTPTEVFEKLLAQRAPELSRRYGEAIATGAEHSLSEAALVRAARRLHALAYPIGRTRR